MKKILFVIAMQSVSLACMAGEPSLWTARESEEKVETVAEDAKQQGEEAMQSVQAFLKECRYFFIATVEGDQPRVRPFGVAEIVDGRLYITTGKAKDVYKQMAANGKFEICAIKQSGSEWMRLSGKLVGDESQSVKATILERNPSLRGMYKEDDDNFAVLYVEDAIARFYTFAGEARRVSF